VALKFHIETFGCQMNKSDSEAMALSLIRSGFTEAGSEDDADIVVYNTCSVREHAENRALSRFRAAKRQVSAKGGIAVLAGCMAQRIGSGLVARGVADLVVGPYQSPVIGEIIREFLKSRGSALFLSQETDDFAPRIDPGLASIRGAFPWHKWVTITHGCENNCTYCIVPSVRGRLISFPSKTILDYLDDLENEGITEVTLLGQNVNQYGTDSGDIPFARLLEKTAGHEGFQRVNFITSHPKDFSDDIIRVIKDHENISRAIHLPLQSGSDPVLAAMNRQYTMGHYMAVVDKINALIPDHSLSTDLIVGFPGETADDFRRTLDAVRTIRFDSAFTYAYSPRQGTPACSLDDSLDHEKKIIRLEELIAVQREIGREKLEARIARTEEAIVERISKKSAHKVMAKTFLDHPVILPGTADDLGKKITVRIESINGTSLLASRVN